MNYEVYQKNNFKIPINIVDEDGNVFDISGATIYFVISNNQESVIVKSNNDDISVTDAVNGALEVDLSATDNDIAVGSYRYELLVIDVLNNRYTALKGEYNVLKSITTDKE